jgi:hypothetical protein
MVLLSAIKGDMLALFASMIDLVLVIVAGFLVKENFPDAYVQFGRWLFFLIPVIVLLATIRGHKLLL